ncbi:MAG: FecR domain-containing protein, partial [Acidobacteria bacterium]|nr:FecR domain-containing protein [Acidobacteriota bacterium]
MSMQPIRSYQSRARAMRGALAPLALGLLLATSAVAQPQYDTAEPQAPPAATADEAQQPQPIAGSYGYLRLVEGSATVAQASSGTTSAAEVNQPVMTGDRISVPPRGRVELVLADHNIVRLDGDTQVELTRLANSADRQDPSTELRLDTGNLQLIVTQDSVGQELPTVLTPNASIY